MVEQLSKICLRCLVKQAMIDGEEEGLMTLIVEDVPHLIYTYVSCLNDLDWISYIIFSERYEKQYAQYPLQKYHFEDFEDISR